MAFTWAINATITSGTSDCANYVVICSTDTSSTSSTSTSSYRPTLEQYQESERRRFKRQSKRPNEIRARKLLMELLTPQQRRTFRKHGWFVVTGNKTGKQYRIHDGFISANIEVLVANDNKPAHRICGHAAENVVPLSDHLIAQKVTLESAEEDFLKIANRYAA